jgi:hypothetical protein
MGLSTASHDTPPDSARSVAELDEPPLIVVAGS